MTVDAAITGACERADSQTPVLGVAVPYAVGNVLLTILGPVIVADEAATMGSIDPDQRHRVPSGNAFATRQ